FFFSSRRRHTISKRDWSSDVCSSDLFLLSVGNSSTRFIVPSKSYNPIFTAVPPISMTKTFINYHPSYIIFRRSFSPIIPYRFARSEERRVGKEVRYCRAGEDRNKNWR